MKIKNKNGENKMTKTKKTGWTLAAALIALGCLGGPARADSDPGNNSGSFIIRITPNIDLGVLVNTDGAALIGSSDLSIVADLGSIKRLGTPVELLTLGNFDNQELTLEVLQQDTWTVDASAGSSEIDALQLFALIGQEQTTTLATEVDFETGVADHLIITTPLNVGQADGDESTDGLNHRFEFDAVSGGVKYEDMDAMIANTPRQLWLSAVIPTNTTVAAEQKFLITVTALSGVGQ